MDKSTVALPAHFEEFYPKFITFLDQYFKWKDRRVPEGQTGEMANGDSFADYFGAGGRSHNMLSDYALEKVEYNLVTSDGVIIQDSSGMDLTAYNVDPHHLKARYDDVPIPIPSDMNINIDDTRVLKLASQIGQLRGTIHAVELFFRMFFNEVVTVTYPRDFILTIDGAEGIDSNHFIRDDYIYDEFSYIIETQYDLSHYIGLIDTIFKPFFHAGGFACFIKQTGTDDIVDITINKFNKDPNVINAGGGVEFVAV